ncbi:hypothetical protein ACH5RR_036218 [Cinchona calisaya]|uniref:Uncharacterized protein n=1 Tax=Cinchona calisaya TaxID=153742 RepID=A0ABD2Y7A2_9GENT
MDKKCYYTVEVSTDLENSRKSSIKNKIYRPFFGLLFEVPRTPILTEEDDPSNKAYYIEKETAGKWEFSYQFLQLLLLFTSLPFIFAVGAELRRNTAKVVVDNEAIYTYCAYGSDASTVYGLSAFGSLLISQTILIGVTKCLCVREGKMTATGKSTTCAVFFYIFSWISFLGAEACLLAGSIRNSYHSKYRAIFGAGDLFCVSLPKGVFVAGAALTLLSMIGSIFYYWAHAKSDTDECEKQNSEGLGMSTTHIMQKQQKPKGEKQSSGELVISTHHIMDNQQQSNEEKQSSERLAMTALHFMENQQQPKDNQFEKI